MSSPSKATNPRTPVLAPLQEVEDLVDALSTSLGIDVAVLRTDGSTLIRSSQGSAPPSAACLDRADIEPFWYEEEGGLVRLVVPLLERRILWGYLTAAYEPIELAGTEPGPRVVHSRRAAVRLLATVETIARSKLHAGKLGGELDQLSEKLLESYEEISLLYRLGQQFKINAPPEEVLAQSCRELQQLLGADRTVACLTIQPGAPKQGRDAIPKRHVEGTRAVTDRLLENLLTGYRDRRLAWGKPHIDNRHRGFGDQGSPARLVTVPICYQSEMLGILAALADVDSKEFDSRDAQLLANVATQIGGHWRNYLLYAEVKDLLYSLVRALVSAIDAKDPYTCGHSVRVATTARAVADELGLGRETSEDCYLAGLLHDIGKIGIREEVLRKPGTLTEEEWEHLRQHPDIGARILEPVEAIAHLIPAVRFHHEAVNGAGYPLGLRGEEIPLLARIVAVADSLDAMTTNRPYRDAMSLERTRNLFAIGSGDQWDANVVTALLSLLDHHVVPADGTRSTA